MPRFAVSDKNGLKVWLARGKRGGNRTMEDLGVMIVVGIFAIGAVMGLIYDYYKRYIKPLDKKAAAGRFFTKKELKEEGHE